MELIRQLQEEEEMRNKAASTKNKDDEMQIEDAMCSICLTSLYSQDFIPLENCPDCFHKACLSEYLKSEVRVQ